VVERKNSLLSTFHNDCDRMFSGLGLWGEYQLAFEQVRVGQEGRRGERQPFKDEKVERCRAISRERGRGLKKPESSP